MFGWFWMFQNPSSSIYLDIFGYRRPNQNWSGRVGRMVCQATWRIQKTSSSRKVASQQGVTCGNYEENKCNWDTLNDHISLGKLGKSLTQHLLWSAGWESGYVSSQRVRSLQILVFECEKSRVRVCFFKKDMFALEKMKQTLEKCNFLTCDLCHVCMINRSIYFDFSALKHGLKHI